MSYSQRLIEHYQKTWGPATQEVRLQEGRVHAEEVYATCCISQPADEARLDAIS